MPQFAVGRLVLGSGVFISSMSALLLVTEISHPKKRSLTLSILVGLMALSGVVYSAINIGIFEYKTTWT